MRINKDCFGKFGNTSCSLILCPHYEKCHKCYWHVVDSLKKKREYIGKIIKDYCSKNNIQVIHRNIKGGERKF